jgi:hypothetical protein
MSRGAILDAPPAAAAAVLGAMRAVALEHGGPGLTEMDRETIGSAALIVFGSARSMSTRSRRSTRRGWRARSTATRRRRGRSGCSR